MAKKVHFIKLTFDVNTRRTGMSLIINDKLQAYSLIETNEEIKKNMGQAMYIDHTEIYKGIAPTMMGLRKALEKENARANMLITFENSKVKVSADTAQKLDLYVGMYIGIVSSIIKSALPMVDIRIQLVLTDWQYKIFGRVLVKGDNSKELSRQAANKKYDLDLDKMNDAGGDIADAINIGSIAEHLIDSATSQWERGTKAQQTKKLKSKLTNHIIKLAEYRLISVERVQRGLSPTDSQLAIKIDSKEKSIANIKLEIEKLKNG